MIYGIFGDIHGNLEALQAVIERMKDEGAERFLCVGDIIGYGADPAKCIEIVRNLNSVVVAGNHDFATIEKLNIDFFNSYAKEAVVWTRKNISEGDHNFLASLELVQVVDDVITIVHGSLKRAWLIQLMTDWIGEDGELKKFSCQYRGMDYPRKMKTWAEPHAGETWWCKGNVSKKYVKDSQNFIECRIWIENGNGEKTTPGTALVTLPSKSTG